MFTFYSEGVVKQTNKTRTRTSLINHEQEFQKKNKKDETKANKATVEKNYKIKNQKPKENTFMIHFRRILMTDSCCDFTNMFTYNSACRQRPL